MLHNRRHNKPELETAASSLFTRERSAPSDHSGVANSKPPGRCRASVRSKDFLLISHVTQRQSIMLKPYDTFTLMYHLSLRPQRPLLNGYIC
jgi:hypothetical protein